MEITGDLEQEQTLDDLQLWFEVNPKLPNKIGKYWRKSLIYV